jgi:dihydrofolate reductase
MRKVVVQEFLTLDGVMQGPGGADEDRRDGFEHGGWMMGNMDEVAGKAVDDGINAADGLLLGRRTYEIFAAYWPNTTDPEDKPLADRLNSMPKHVASRTLKEPLEWENSTLLTGDVAEAVAKLKDGPGKDLLVIGSGDLAQTLMKHDLIDEYQLQVNPIVLGTGRRLFRDGSPMARLRLVDATTSGTGVQILRYQPERDES